ncbi:hypothetical protein D9M68_768590 [compost metagenome]
MQVQRRHARLEPAQVFLDQHRQERLAPGPIALDQQLEAILKRQLPGRDQAILAGNFQVETGVTQGFARQDMNPGGLDRIGRDVMEGLAPAALVREDGDVAMIARRHHEAVAAVERCRISRIDTQVALEALQEGNRLAAVGDGVEIPGQVALILQLAPTGIDMGGGGGRHILDPGRGFDLLPQKTCQQIQALEWGFQRIQTI